MNNNLLTNLHPVVQKYYDQAIANDNEMAIGMNSIACGAASSGVSEENIQRLCSMYALMFIEKKVSALDDEVKAAAEKAFGDNK